ncbi:Crustacean CHH/MIH/GIH neurohormone family protein [Trichostrongylus colubriformis]|uniref:Crustacean CHH/MIH/GIH neurohormone family protein n=1 Tax=Trichostrongylus colubriformis TaxID=6319 RepID=A0AAN8FLK7_TRICO
MTRLCLFLLTSSLLLYSVPHFLCSKADVEVDKKCKVHRSPPVHHVMDQVCLLCHEMFSHEVPNLRADCRANCFRNDLFPKCIAMFSTRKN